MRCFPKYFRSFQHFSGQLTFSKRSLRLSRNFGAKTEAYRGSSSMRAAGAPWGTRAAAPSSRGNFDLDLRGAAHHRVPWRNSVWIRLMVRWEIGRQYSSCFGPAWLSRSAWQTSFFRNFAQLPRQIQMTSLRLQAKNLALYTASSKLFVVR